MRIAAAVLLATAFAVQAPGSQVQVGVCAPLRELANAKAAGFEYVELGTSEIAGLSDADFESAVTRIREVGILTPASNLFIPAALKVTGPEVDADQLMAYVRKAFTRMSRLGVKVIVFGSGGARRLPDGFSKEAGFKQLVDFGRRIAPEAQRAGITVAIEPLRRQETNIINSAAEGFELVKAIGHPNFQLMVDFYHLASEREDPEIIVRARDNIVHLHMANPQGRVYPLAWEEYDYAGFFENLRRIGYDKRISVEASTKDMAADAPRAIALLHRAFISRPAR